MDGYSLHRDPYRAGYSAAPPPAAAPAPVPAPPPAPSPAPAPYYGAYPPPSYGYPPSTADRWASFPLPAVDPSPYPSYPSFPLDRTPAYGSRLDGHLPFQSEPLRHPHSYPGPAQQTFMPPPQRGRDAGRFRKKKPMSQQNLRPKNKPFKQTQQSFKAGGKAVEQKTAQEGKKAGKADLRAAKSTSQGDPLTKDVQELHSLWRTRVDEAPGAFAGKKRKGEPQEKGEGKPARKDEGKTIRMGEKGGHAGWKKTRRKKNRKQRRNRDTNGDANGNATAEKGEKRRKGEEVPMTEEEMQEAEASLEVQRDARKSIHEFLYGPLERSQDGEKAGSVDTDAQKTGSQDEEKAGIEVADAQMVEGGDAQQDQSQYGEKVGRKDADAQKTGSQDGDKTEIGDADTDAQMVESGDAQQAQNKDALESEKNNAQNLVNGGEKEPVNDDEQKTETNEQKSLGEDQKSLGEDAQSFEKEHDQKQETLTPEELKAREEKGFEFFSKLLEENKELRKLYLEKCNNGVFECLMCHSKMNKKFSNLVSLVTHASNVLKTKKLPEHRGYGRAVCSLLGWDPCRIPRVPRGKGSRSAGESAPGDNESVPGDNANNSTTKQEISKDVQISEVEEGNLEASNKDAEGGNEQPEEAKVTDDAGDVQTDGEAIQDSAA